VAEICAPLVVAAPTDLFAKALAASGRSSALKHVTPLVPEASTRRYYRLELEDSSMVVAVVDTASGIEQFVRLQSYLEKNGISVPRVFFAGEVLLQEDLGDVSFNQHILANNATRENAYRTALDHMLSWQRLKNDGTCTAFKASFNVEKLMFEFDFFFEHTLLTYWRSDVDVKRLRANFLKVAEILSAPKNKVFTHRDYHSRNIMIKENRQFIIDFQDARLGLMQYDLCSLLCDAYAPNYSPKLLVYAYETGRDIHGESRDEFEYLFRLSAYQRLIKAMGTFGRQAALGRKDFQLYIEPAKKLLVEVCGGDKSLPLWFL